MANQKEDPMDIRYFEPLSRAYKRMKVALFKPFDLRKWFVVGFTAFLAGLTDFGGGGGGGQGKMGDGDWEEALYFPRTAQQWLADHPQWFLLITFGLVLVLILVVVLTWLSSRGKFMFLDNVVHDRAQVAKPWYEFKSEAFSLFLWRVGIGILVLAVVIPYLVYCYTSLVGVYEQGWDVTALIFPFVTMILGLIAFLVLVTYVNLLLVDFVVPLMYRSRINVLAGWGVFLPLFGKHLLSFIGYGLFILVLKIAVGIGIVIVGIFTCCIGFVLMVIPYIGSVFLLPISYTFRALSVEFLEQYGAEYQFFPKADPDKNGTTSTAT
jgi:hypothetical protein